MLFIIRRVCGGGGGDGGGGGSFRNGGRGWGLEFFL